MPLTEADIYRFDEFELEPSNRRFSRNGAQLALYPKAFEVLTFLVANPGRVVSKEEIFKSVWPDSFVEEGNLARQISSLRRAMGDRSGCIITIPGRGYQFVATVEGALNGSPSQGHSEEVLVQRVRERTQVVIEESFPVRVAVAPRTPVFGRISRHAMVWSVLGLVVAGVAATYLRIHFSKPPELRKVLVADLLNLTGDQTFDLTLKSALVAGIGQSPWIQIMGAGEVNSVLTAMEKPLDTPLLGDTALEVCRRAGYQAMLRPRLESSLDKSGYRTSLDVVNCATGATMAAYKAGARNKDELLGTFDSISLRARRTLGEPNKSLEEFQVPFYNVTTTSFEALLAYFQGV
jgi:DNA-binding winged helix-turn-helix (wHTH) protein